MPYKIKITPHRADKMTVLMISIKTKENTNILSNIFGVLEETGIKFISCISQKIPEKQGIQTTLLIIPPNDKETLREFIQLIKQQPITEKVEIIELPLNVDEARIVGITLLDFYYFFGKLEEMGTAGEALLFHIGYNAGSSLARDAIKSIKTKQRAVEYLKMYFESLGLGLLHIVHYVEGKEAVIRIYDNVECSAMRRKTVLKPEIKESHTSNLIRGLMAGFFEKIFEKPVSVIETRCIVRNSPYCEFVIRPRK